MTVEGAPRDGTDADLERGWVHRIGSDWWAVIVVGAITALAVAGLLPKIPW